MGNTATTLHLRSRSAATGEEASDGESHEDEGKGGGEAVVEEGRALPGSEGQGLGKQRIGRAPSSTAVSRMRRFEEVQRAFLSAGSTYLRHRVTFSCSGASLLRNTY
jgi:hypothetical protein